MIKLPEQKVKNRLLGLFLIIVGNTIAFIGICIGTALMFALLYTIGIACAIIGCGFLAGMADG